MPATPNHVTVEIGDVKFDALSASIEATAPPDSTYRSYLRPLMGRLDVQFHVSVNAHDDVNLPFGSLQELMSLALNQASDQIRDIKINYWKDESRNDVIASFSFEGWIYYARLEGTGQMNHRLDMILVPKVLSDSSYIKINITN
jgi:hypothetical protein